MSPTSSEKTAVAEATDLGTFDLLRDPVPSFAALQSARHHLYQSRRQVDAFERAVLALPGEGEEGRRRGFGCWMLARYEEAAALLARHADDDVAAFTRASALVALERFEEAEPIFERLSNAYPDEPRPRAGWIECKAETLRRKGGEDEAAAQEFERRLADSPEAFRASAEGRHLEGRAFELRRDWEKAIGAYRAAHALDSQHRNNLFRLALLSERWGDARLALECYEILADQRPVDRAVLMNLGVLYEDLGRDRDAAACYEVVVRTFPADRRARLFLADAKAGMEMFYDEDLERKEDRLNQILRTPITDFELSVRARNCLNKMNILTLGDLVRKTEVELLSYKNFGETSLLEIKEILGSKGLRLGMGKEEAVQSIELHRKRYVGVENAEAMNRPVSDLELSIRARRTVEALGCLTLGDIVQHSEEEMLGMPNFGQTSLQELRDKLSQYELKLKSRKE